MKNIFLVFLILFTGSIAISQTEFSKKEKKKLKKVQKLADKKKYAKALDLAEPLVQNHLLNTELWKSYISLAYLDYQENGYLTDQLFGGLTVTTTDKDGNEIENDSLAQELMNLLNTKPGEEKLLHIIALGTNCVFDLEKASIIARIYGVDAKLKVPYSNNEKALTAYKKAEQAFGKRNYGDAAKYYKEAVDADSTFYKATLYLGDALYAQDKPFLALPYYKKAAQMQPLLLEPKKYLTDAYIKANEFDNAQTQCINALITYPDVGMFYKLITIAKGQNKAIDLHWVSTPLTPNKIAENQNEKLDKPWNFYREAKNEISDQTNTVGLIANHPSKIEYLEVYSWHYMLSNLKKEDYPELAFAFKMKEEGYLDCYVLFSLFNINLYSQYQHFAQNNEEKLKTYIKKYIID